jgi:5-formyltetrahydrofolate cyclo-ligase
MNDSSAQNPIEMKKRMRQDALRRRASAHQRLKATAGGVIRDLGLPLIAGLNGSSISGFMPIRDEIDVVALLTGLVASGRNVSLPCIVSRSSPLVFRAWKPGDTLADRPFGLQEPLEAAPVLVPDILLVPLSAFDSAGYRIGYGGGYFDRTLEQLRARGAVTAIGVAYDEQEVPRFAHEPHDQRLDYLLTPTGIRTFGA